MTYSFASTPARLVGRYFATAATAAMVTVYAGAAAMAQQPAPAPAQQRPAAPAPARPATPPAARPAAPAPAKPAAPAAQQQAPAAQQPPAGQAQQAPGPNQAQMIYSPWVKFCLKGPEKDAKQVCFTGSDGRLESGQPVVAAVLIEPDDTAAKKVFRVTVPLGVQLGHGTRILIDQNQPLASPFVICFTNGCMADYEASADLIGKVKKGQTLVIQAVNAAGVGFNLPLPLTNFQKASEGAPTDPKVFEEQQKKLQDELQKRASEARQKLEQAQPQKTQ